MSIPFYSMGIPTCWTTSASNQAPLFFNGRILISQLAKPYVNRDNSNAPANVQGGTDASQISPLNIWILDPYSQAE
jgi:hypothetical protein